MDLNFSFIILSCFAIAITVAQYNENPQQYRQISNNGPQINYAPKQIPYQPKPIAYPSYQASYTSDYKKPATPQPLILSHRQSLTHDGGFKYQFAADNGLQQGETIAPDGTRLGQYSYVDPSGQQITVKYSAGKEGFRILEGAHIPQPVEAQQIQKPAPQGYQSYQAPEPPTFRYNSAPQLFNAPVPKFTQYYQQPQQQQQNHQPRYPAPIPIPRYVQYKNIAQNEERRVQDNVIQKEPEYNDEPGKPHSFGTGYSFEFSG